jgi:flagellin
MQINHNVRAMVTQHALYQNNSAMSKSLEKLSTGLRINRAQDDAAGLAMSEQMRSQIRGLGKAKQNAQDGIAALQIAEGGLAEITNMIQRQRELAIQAATDTVTSTEREYLNYEYQQLAQEIDRIANTTDYNTINMLKEFGTPTCGTLHIGANSTVDPGQSHSYDPSSNAVGITYNVSVVGNTNPITERASAETSIDQLSATLKSISGMRANIGSFINRLEYTINNIASLEYNTQDAESRIRDTDFGKETTNFTRNQILVQSATSMLAQANSLPQTVLGLLG